MPNPPWLPSTVKAADSIPLGQKQRHFALEFARWVIWVCAQPGYEVSYGEGYVGDTDAADRDYDGPHMREGAHYHRLAMDVNLFYRGEYITDGSHPAWSYIGLQWETMHPLARWGGRFGDANHLSFEHEGVK